MKHTCKELSVAALLVTLSLAATTASLGKPSSKETAAKSSQASSDSHAMLDKLVAQRAPLQPLGIIVANVHDFEGEDARQAKKELQMSDRLQVIFVQPNSLADRLGLIPGDELIQFNEHYVSRGKTALQQLEDRILPQIDWTEEIQATIIRDGFGQTRSVPKGNAVARGDNSGGSDS